LKNIFIITLLLISILGYSQTKYAPIAFTSFTFPQSTRSIGLGSAGTALDPDASSINLNPARLCFIDEKINISLDSYIIPTLSNGNISKFTSLKYVSNNNYNSIGIGLNSYTLGEINQVSDYGDVTKISLPDEYKLSIADALFLSKNTSIGISIDYLNKPKLLYSNIPGISNFMGGVGLLNKTILSSSNDQQLLNGIAIENIGTLSKDGYFLPTTFSFGSTFMQGYNDIINFRSSYLIGIEFSKLLVPSLPIYDNEGNIIKGTDPNKISGIKSIANSFFDDPYGKNLAKWRVQIFSEVKLIPTLSLRSGFSYENIKVGNRNYFTLGAGYQYKNEFDNIDMDIAYIIPTNNISNIYKNIFSLSLKYKMGTRW
jgi:hypothetical protein